MNELAEMVAKEKYFLRCLGNNQVYFHIEVHVTKSKFKELCEDYACVTKPDFKYFMGCPIVIDNENFVCTVHKKEVGK